MRWLFLLGGLCFGCQGVIGDPSGETPGVPPPEVVLPTGSGIPLDPPEGIGELAAECDPDVAPLRRLNHYEYGRTIRDLFEGVDVPDPELVADERRHGFTNNYAALGISDFLVRRYFDNAVALSEAAAPQLVANLDCAPSAECMETFVRDFGRRAYRRELTDAEVTELTGFYAEGPMAGNFEGAVEMATLLLLQSPDFLYRPELGDRDAHLTQYEVASRLSYFLWGSMPDEALLDAAASGTLRGEALRTEVGRMLTDPKAREGLLTATLEWLDLERLETQLKGEGFLWSDDIRDDLVASLERFLWERGFASDGSIDELMTSPGVYVNETIAPLFGVTDAGPELEWRELDAERSGILTHPAILARYARGSYPSPVQRGVFILTELLCDEPRPPPDDIGMTEPPTEDESGDPITNRDGYEELTQSDASCALCHDAINPIGFAFESYDTVGSHRTTDNGQPVDTSGVSVGFTLGEELAFDDAHELTQELAASDRVRGCIVDRWVRYATGGGGLAYDPCLRDELEELAQQPDVGLRDLVIAIAVHPKLVDTEVVPHE